MNEICDEFTLNMYIEFICLRTNLRYIFLMTKLDYDETPRGVLLTRLFQTFLLYL